jgi:hypothetical protein
MPAVLPLVGSTELDEVFVVLGIENNPYLGQTRVELLKQILVALCNT